MNDPDVTPRASARLAVLHLVSSYDTISPAMAASAVLGDAGKARSADLFAADAESRYVEAVLGVADALLALRGEDEANKCTGAHDCPGPHVEGCYGETPEGREYARSHYGTEPPRAVAWAVLDAEGAVISVQQSRTIALDDAEYTDGAHVAPLVVAALDEVASDEGAPS